MALDKNVQKAVASAGAGEVAAVKKFLASGGLPDVADFLGATMLRRAIGQHRVEVVTVLLDAGAKVEEADVALAKKLNHEGMLTLLASRGVKVAYVPFAQMPQDEKDARLLTFIKDQWSSSDFEPKLKELVDAGANLNALHAGLTPLLVLAKEGANGVNAARAMMRLGARVDAVDSEGRNALHRLAIDASGRDFAFRVIERGVPVDSRDATGKTALHHAAAATYHSSLTFIEMLVKQGADLRAVDSQGQTPTSLAKGAIKAWFLERTAPTIDEKDRQLLRAVADGKLDDVRRWLAEGANPTTVDSSGATYGYFKMKGVSALHLAMNQYVPVEIALTLLSHPGIDVNGVDLEQNTPLHHAVAHAVAPTRIQLVDRLVSRGANVMARNDRGDTCVTGLISFRKLEDELELFAFLESKGLQLAQATSGFTLIDEMYQRMQRFSEVTDQPGFAKMMRFLVDRGVTTQDPAMQKWAIKWLRELEEKFSDQPKPKKPRSSKTTLDFSALQKKFGESAELEVRGKKAPVAFFDWRQLEAEHENYTSEHAAAIWEYHVPEELQNAVRAEQLIPIGVVGMTGAFESFEEEMTDGTLFVDLSQQKNGDAPVVFAEKDEESLELVSPSFTAVLASLGAEAKKSTRKPRS